MLARKAAAGAERGSLEPGHAHPFLGLTGRQLAAGTWRPVPAHKSLLVALLDTTALRGQLCRAALLRIVSAEAWSFRLASDRRFLLWQLTSAPGIHKWPPGSVGVWAARAV